MCEDDAGYHEYANQTSNNATYTALDGDLYTGDPTVPDVTEDSTYSHIYMFENGLVDYPEVEVGWYVGRGNPISVTSPNWYTTFWDEYLGYIETDSTSGSPTSGSTYEYKLAYAGIDPDTDEPEWNFYWDTIESPQQTWDVAQMMPAEAAVLAGEEGNTPNGHTVPLQSKGTNLTIKDSSGSWINWDSSISTQVCTDPGTTITENTEYTAYTASGGIN